MGGWALPGWLVAVLGVLVVVAGLRAPARWQHSLRPRKRPTAPGWSAGLLEIWNRCRLAVHRGDGWELGFERLVGRVAGLLASGQGLNQSLQQVAGGADPCSRQLGDVLKMVQAGVPLLTALHSWSGRHDPELLGRLQAIIMAHERTGAPLARPLLTLANQCQRRRQVRAAAASQTSQTKWTAIVLLVLPPSLTLYFLLIRRDMFLALVGTSLGRLSLVYAAGSWILGGIIIGKLISRVTSSTA